MTVAQVFLEEQVSEKARASCPRDVCRHIKTWWLGHTSRSPSCGRGILHLRGIGRQLASLSRAKNRTTNAYSLDGNDNVHYHSLTRIVSPAVPDYCCPTIVEPMSGSMRPLRLGSFQSFFCPGSVTTQWRSLHSYPYVGRASNARRSRDRARCSGGFLAETWAVVYCLDCCANVI